ncbi:MAG TPA: zinc ribbon domain-containing protein [Blastocatellia bacterium]|nr:zinc ribbon domain-containing protein [Blastocatellia bacterium]
MPSRTVSQDLDTNPTGDLGFEIDLYSELSNFADQSPDERKADVERIVVKAPITGSLRGKSQPLSDGDLPTTSEVVLETEGFEQPSEGVDDVMPSLDVDDLFPNEPPAEIHFKNYAPNVTDEPFQLDSTVTEEPVQLDSVFEPGPNGAGAVLGNPNEVICADCGAVSNRDDLLCIGCGAFLGEFDSTAPTIEAAAPAVEAAPVEPAAPTCTDCGEEVTAEEVFCPGCGAVLG